MQNRQQVIEFLTHLKWSSTLQVSTLKEPIKFSEVDWLSNIYFCWWLKSWLNKRCEDNDIWLKKYIGIDIDIRNDHYLKTSEVIDQETLRQTIWEIVARLAVKWYDDYCAIVDSGNGVHFYRTWSERIFDKEVYANGIKQLQTMINYIISDLWYVCDPACTNLSRIMRLPWTINPRKKETKNIKYDLWPIEAEILRFEPKDSDTFESLEMFAELYKDQSEKDKKEKIEAKREIKGNYKKSDDIRSEINSIPVWQIAEYVRWVEQTQDDGEIITLKERHKNMWAYVYKPFNVLYNQWSSLIKTDRKVFTPFELVCFELMDWNQHNTVKRFEEKYWIKTNKELVIEKKEYKRQWFLFPDDIFDNTFDCIMSGELVTIVAESNTGKTTFAMDMIERNVSRGKKCLYINLEFGIEQVATNNWLFMNGKKKRNITDIDPLDPEDQKRLDAYIKKYLSKFDHISFPWWIKPDDLYKLLIEKSNQWYGFVVIDTFAMIEWNADDKAYYNQNKCMENLQKIVQNTWLCILQLHHTNKNGVMEWSKKILNLSNTLITLTQCIDDYSWETYTEWTLTKDKFTTKNIVPFYWKDRKRHLYDK